MALLALDRTMQDLASITLGWDSYGGEMPTQVAISNATAIASKFINNGLIPDAIAPSAEGGVAICFMRNDKYADIECFNSGEILAVRYSSQDDPKAWVIEASASASDATLQTVSNYLSA